LATFWEESVVERVGHFIGGQEVFDGDGSGSVFDPSTGQVVREVAFANKAVTDRAVIVAAEAQAAWAELSLVRRQRVMFDYRGALLANQKAIVNLISEEHGKVTADAQGEFMRGVEVVEFACSLPQLLKGQYSDSVSTGVDAFTVRFPLGVVAGITPFNFPAMVPMWMFPLALAVGNGFVLKPSEKVPSTAKLLAELFIEAGGPPGLFNVVNGDRETVNLLIDHPLVKGISFVGSTPVAKHVYSRAALAGKRVQALGGAKNHMVVLPDADPELSASQALAAGFGSTGERCMAISVLVLVGDNDRVLDSIVEQARLLRVGSYREPDSAMGPLISAAHRERVSSLIEEAVSKGAKVLLDGREHPATAGPGFFLGPTVIDGIDTSMEAYRQEIFGPVLLVVRAASLDDAIRLINDNPYANGAALFTASGEAARRFYKGIDAGMVGINVSIPVPVAYHSFGGFKNSLFGDTHVHGEEGIKFYTRAKAITQRWPRSQSEGYAADLGFMPSK
jgi:malonate-semialdehyde dehydrogenase (acetylating)/methylmalonate-semialdehyde dehydrogenase